MARYRPDGSRRRPSEWAERATDAAATPDAVAAAVSNVAAISVPTAHTGHTGHEGAGEVLRRGDGILVYLMNIPRPEEIREEVDELGAVTLPLIGKINITGLRTSQAEDAIKDAYISGGFYRKIDVIVMADAGTYYVRGEVKRPGSFPLSGDITLIQAIITAGGYTDFAKRSKIKVISGSRDMTFDGDKIEDGEEADPLIKANDTIIVQRRWM
ncbi:MAG: SLBB domain-containing protein [Kiritimatiellia bacterium]|nr:SLBB domain-containing protein [Kiritimatiellia bacterium]